MNFNADNYLSIVRLTRDNYKNVPNEYNQKYEGLPGKELPITWSTLVQYLWPKNQNKN